MPPEPSGWKPAPQESTRGQSRWYRPDAPGPGAAIDIASRASYMDVITTFMRLLFLTALAAQALTASAADWAQFQADLLSGEEIVMAAA